MAFTNEQSASWYEDAVSNNTGRSKTSKTDKSYGGVLSTPTQTPTIQDYNSKTTNDIKTSNTDKGWLGTDLGTGDLTSGTGEALGALADTSSVSGTSVTGSALTSDNASLEAQDASYVQAPKEDLPTDVKYEGYDQSALAQTDTFIPAVSNNNMDAGPVATSSSWNENDQSFGGENTSTPTYNPPPSGSSMTATVEEFPWGSFADYTSYNYIAPKPDANGNITTPSGGYYSNEAKDGRRADYYYGTSDPTQLSWNSYYDKVVSGELTGNEAIMKFVSESGLSGRQLDETMGWEKGTAVKSLVEINGGDKRLELAFLKPENNIQNWWNSYLNDAVNDPNVSDEQAMKNFINYSLEQGYSLEYLDYATLVPKGTFASQAAKVGITVDGTTSGTTPGTSTPTDPGAPPATGTTPPAGPTTDMPGTGIITDGVNMIPMDDSTNTGAVNMGATAAITKGTMFDDTGSLLASYDADALYTPKESEKVSDALNTLIADDSDYLKIAKENALASMTARGLGGSSIAAAAMSRSLVEAALPIAQGDVQVSMFNADAYNKMMDSRQNLYGDMSLGAQRGSIQFLGSMQEGINGLISADVQNVMDKEMENLKHKNELDLEDQKWQQDLITAQNLFEDEATLKSMQYQSTLYNSFQATLASINSSTMKPSDKDEAGRVALAQYISGLKQNQDIAAGIKIDYDDFGLSSNNASKPSPNEVDKYAQFSPSIKSNYTSGQLDDSISFIEEGTKWYQGDKPNPTLQPVEANAWTLGRWIDQNADNLMQNYPVQWKAAMKDYNGSGDSAQDFLDAANKLKTTAYTDNGLDWNGNPVKDYSDLTS